MSVIEYILAGIYVILCVILIVIVLFQNSKQQGLSGAIAGTAETFFGKNKGRTIDAKLKKFTAYGAALFIILSIVLAYIVVKATQTPPAS